jgi:TRAP-type C4-dicarboxylate transport system permease small subunit
MRPSDSKKSTSKSLSEPSCLARAGRLLARISNLVSLGPKWIGIIALLIMMSLITGDILLRASTNKPIEGTYEITEYAMIILIFFALPYTAVKDGHVTVDLVYHRLSPRARAVMDSIAYLLSVVLFVLISWQSIMQGLHLRSCGEVSLALRIPSYPFAFVAALGSAFLCLVLLARFIESLAKVSRR